MRRHWLAVSLPLALLAAPAAAQDAPELSPNEDEVAERLSDTLSDPERQQKLALTARVLSEVLLDLPLAPLLQPLADVAGELADEDVPAIDPDTTLRRMAPGAGDMPERIERELPRAMDRLAGASDALATLLPVLRETAERLKDTLPRDLADAP